MEKYCTKLNERTDEVLLSVKKASKSISDMVSKTAGPFGSNVMLINGQNCRITKDGITVLRYIVEPETEADKIALSVIRSASGLPNTVNHPKLGHALCRDNTKVRQSRM